MNENRISISLSQADIDAINQAIATLAARLEPVLIALEAADKKNLAKLGEKSVSFVGKSLQYAASNPEFLPAFVDAGEMQKDFTAFNQLNGFLRPLQQITKNLDDTATLRRQRSGVGDAGVLQFGAPSRQAECAEGFGDLRRFKPTLRGSKSTQNQAFGSKIISRRTNF